MTIKLIVAVDQGNAIGWSDGRLPWKLPEDMKRFKELTTGHTVVMGFNTFASLGRFNGLPNRKNLVLTRKNPIEARGRVGDDVDIISSLNYVQKLNQRAPQDTIWIIGGASVYEEAISLGIVDEFYITLVDADSKADVRLKTDFAAWKLWTIREARAGRRWCVSRTDHLLDNGFHTSYFHIWRAT